MDADTLRQRLIRSIDDALPGPEYPHHLLNTSDAPLKYLSISTRQRPELCEYPDLGKVMAWAPGVKVLQRPA